MQITYQGQDYSFDHQKISVDEWRELKRKYKMTPKAFETALDEADPDAMTFLYWVMLRQAGQDKNLTLGDHLKPDLIALNGALARAVAAEQEAAAAEADGGPGPTTSRGPALSPASSPPPPATPGPALNGREVSAPSTVS